MKIFVAFLAIFVLATSSAVAQQEEEAQTQVATNPQWLFPYPGFGLMFPNPFFPTLPPMSSPHHLPSFPFPTLPPLPSFKPPSGAASGGPPACLKDLQSFLKDGKLSSLSSDCCGVLKKIESPVVQNLVKQFCGAKSPPSA